MRQDFFSGKVCETAEKLFQDPSQDPTLFNYLDSLCFGQLMEFLETIIPLESSNPERLQWEQLLYYLLCCPKEELNEVLPKLRSHPDPLIRAVIARRIAGDPITLKSHPCFSDQSFQTLKEHWNQDYKTPLPALGPSDPLKRYSASHYPTHFLNSFFKHLENQSFQTTEELSPLLHLTQKRHQKRGTPPYKIAHVTSQIIDHKHAPSLVIERIIKNHNRERFEPILCVTEAFVIRNNQYPVLERNALASVERGKKRLASLNVPVVMGEGTLYDTIDQMCTALKDVDVALFHEADPINLAIAAKCDVPLKVYYQQARPLRQPFFDLWVRCFIATEEQQAFAQETETRIGVAPLPIDKEIGQRASLPFQGKLLATVSNHLETRVTPTFAGVVDAILERNPEALYLPIGPIEEKEAFLAQFSFRDRVRPIGAVLNPGAFAHQFSLYLNEFPEGSGLGLVDAMSGGCPIVSMFDPKGPESGFGGAVFFGQERCVSTPEEYIALATKLLQDPDSMKEWREYATKQYEIITDCKATVEALEQILLAEIKAVH